MNSYISSIQDRILYATAKVYQSMTSVRCHILPVSNNVRNRVATQICSRNIVSSVFLFIKATTRHFVHPEWEKNEMTEIF